MADRQDWRLIEGRVIKEILYFEFVHLAILSPTFYRFFRKSYKCQEILKMVVDMFNEVPYRYGIHYRREAMSESAWSVSASSYQSRHTSQTMSAESHVTRIKSRKVRDK